jgi:uncharacterized small protein (DUF1192 family)
MLDIIRTMRKIVIDLMQYRAADAYRGSSDESDSVEQIGGLPPIGVADAKRSKYRFSDEQLEAALQLLSVNSLPDLARQDFSEFGKKLSWIQLAQGCVTRLAGDVLMLIDVGETAERCALLHHRLENRKAARIRTPNDAQNAIQTLYTCCMTVRNVWKLRVGRRIPDVERAVAKMQGLMPSWRAVSTLALVTPETARLTSMVKEALSNVIQSAEVSEGVKTMARRGLLQWGGHAQLAGPTGTSVSFDSDDE